MTLSLYLHIPFCQVRCAYCDFNTYAGLENLMPAYARALAREVRIVGALPPLPLRGRGGRGEVHTIYFGGGTPSLLPLPLLSEVFAAIHESFDLTPGCEITMEANPGTVDLRYLEGLRALGVNRLSFGMQSAQPAELRLLDRLHTFEQTVDAVRWARQAGFDNLNLDLIYALPHQTMAAWQDTIQRALTLEPEHLSLYALSLENGTPMRAWIDRGRLPMPDPDRAADMYEWASEALEKYGFVQYEISNWEKGNMRCRHNMQYWRNRPYLGLGAGAHGCVNGWRYSTVRAPRAYIERMKHDDPHDFPFSPALAHKQPVDRQTEMNDTMLLGLRLIGEGVREADFRTRYGVGLADAYAGKLAELRSLGLLYWNGTGARLTYESRLVANLVFQKFI